MYLEISGRGNTGNLAPLTNSCSRHLFFCPAAREGLYRPLAKTIDFGKCD